MIGCGVYNGEDGAFTAAVQYCLIGRWLFNQVSFLSSHSFYHLQYIPQLDKDKQSTCPSQRQAVNLPLPPPPPPPCLPSLPPHAPSFGDDTAEFVWPQLGTSPVQFYTPTADSPLVCRRYGAGIQENDNENNYSQAPNSRAQLLTDATVRPVCSFGRSRGMK